jgi:hypothetical protein
MRKATALIAAAGLLIATGLASAQSQTPRNYDSSGAPQTLGSQQRSGGGMSGGPTTGSSGNGMTGAPSSSIPQEGGGPGGLTTSPHQVPENPGAPNSTAPSGNAR